MNKRPTLPYARCAWMAALAIGWGGSSGCSLTQRMVTALDRSHEINCSDGLCGEPAVSLEAPQGYLAEGPTFSGKDITGPPAKSAIDELVELKAQLVVAEDRIKELDEQLALAQQTMLQQGQAIDAASKELQLAMDDYSRMRDNLSRWYEDLRELDDRYHADQDEQDSSLDSLEEQLRGIIEQCEGAMAHQQAAARLVPRESFALPLQGPALGTPVHDDGVTLGTIAPVVATEWSTSVPRNRDDEHLAPIVEAR